MPIGNTCLTLSDWAKRVDPKGKVPQIVELLSKTNQILADMRWMEGNLPTGDRITVRTGLPTVFWRMLNQGVPTSKSVTAQFDEATGMLEAFSEVDIALADLNGNAGAFRLTEASAFLEAMNQTMTSTLFYGNSAATPQEFTGLSTRYSSLEATNAQNIINAGGTGSTNSSIWLVCWGPNTIYGIFPTGSKAGLTHEDLGRVTVENANGVTGARMQAYRDHWVWKAGIALKDWRYVARICNIDTLAKTADLIQAMIQATHRIPNLALGTPTFYMNRSMLQLLDIERFDYVAHGGGVRWDTIDGMRVASFRGIPIRLNDSLLVNEGAVS